MKETYGKHTLFLYEKKIMCEDVSISTSYGLMSKTSKNNNLHEHAGYEFHIIRSGKGYFTTNDKKFKLLKNSAILIPPSTFHMIEIDNDYSFSDLTLAFNYKKISDHRAYQHDKLYDLFEKFMPKPGSPLVFHEKYYSNFYDSFINEHVSNPTIASALIKNMLGNVYIHLLQSIQNSQANQTNISIFSNPSSAITSDTIIFRNIEKYMGDITSDLSIDGLSNVLKMSRRNVQRIMMKLYGKSFSKYLSDIRLSEAIRLMQSTEKSLAEICSLVGYNQYSSFRKAFISKYNMTPSRFREQTKKRK